MDESKYPPSGASFELGVVLVECGRAGEFIALLDSLSQSNRWFDAARAYATGELVRAADLYAGIGSAPAEAYVRACAADALSAEGREEEAAEQRTRACAFYRSVGATLFLATDAAAATV